VLDRRDESQTNAFADVGLAMHETQEGFYKGELMPWDLVPFFEEKFFNAGEFPPNKFVNLRDTYYKQCIEFIESWQLPTHWEVIAVEEQVNLNVDGYPFVGFCDLLLKNTKNGKLIVLDWKSKAEFKTKQEQSEYARQLYFYSTYFREKYKMEVDMLVFVMFRKNKVVPIVWKEQGEVDAKQWLVDTIQEISLTTEFSVTDDDFFGNYLCNHRNDDRHILGANYSLEELIR
jgi:hypothetical protein